MTITRTLELPFLRAKRMAQAVLPHTSNDDVTPILTMANVTGPHIVATDRYSVGQFLLQDDVAKPDASLVGLSVKHGGTTREKHEAQVRTWEREHLVTRTLDGEPVETFEDDFLVPRGALTRLSTLHKGLTLTHPLDTRVRLTLTGLTGAGTLQKSPETPLLRVDLLERLNGDERTTLSQTWITARGNYPPVHRLIDGWEPDDGEGGTRFSLMPSNLGKITRFAGRHEPFILEAGKRVNNGRALGPMRVKIGKDFVALLQPNLILD